MGGPGATSADAGAQGTNVGHRPLLVLLDRDFDSARYWSTYLDLASPAGTADLALCDLAFESPESARERLAGSPPFQNVVAILIDAPGAPPVLIARPARFPEAFGFVEADVAERLRPWLDEQERSLRAAIAPDDATFARREDIVLGMADSPRVVRAVELTRLGRERQRRAAPARARGVRTGSCGELQAEDRHSDAPIYACGIGSLSTSARRFLDAYTAR